MTRILHGIEEAVAYADEMDRAAKQAYVQAEQAVIYGDGRVFGPEGQVLATLAIAKVGLATIANDRARTAMIQAQLLAVGNDISTSVEKLTEQLVASSEMMIYAIDKVRS